MKDPVTNKGVPACFLITDNEITASLSLWFFWLKSNLHLNVKKIMTDSFGPEISIITGLHNKNTKVFTSRWHIKRIWETHIEKHASSILFFFKNDT